MPTDLGRFSEFVNKATLVSFDTLACKISLYPLGLGYVIYPSEWSY
jgi:hypothetical protein